MYTTVLVSKCIAYPRAGHNIKPISILAVHQRIPPVLCQSGKNTANKSHWVHILVKYPIVKQTNSKQQITYST